MALWEFSNLNKYNSVRTRLISMSESDINSLNLENFGVCIVKRFKYRHTHHIAPMLFTNENGKWILPTWTPVHKDTLMEDIEWVIETKSEPKVESDVWKFKSFSDENVIYTVRKVGLTYKCDCPGSWRAKGKECKHLKLVKEGLAS